MAKRKSAPTNKLPQQPSKPLAAHDEAQPYRGGPNARFAPYDNLYDAIRHDLKEFGLGGGFDLKLPKRGGCWPPADE